MEMKFIPKSEFDRVSKAGLDWKETLPLIAKMCRMNTLFEVKRAGSGHLGSSFSAMDIVIFLYYRHLNLRHAGIENPDRDIYFSSKGHDVPGQYAALYSMGIVPEEKFLALRRLGGLDGHPDVKIPGIEANTGSLGMGISKARGMAFAKRYQGWQGKVVVMTGDGEWQEGENFEALQSTVQQKRHDFIVVMDHNKLQSDRYIDRIVSLGDLPKKLSSFGWHVERCDGHDYLRLEECFAKLNAVQDKPKFLICDTIKGRGVSFMEHPVALEENNGYYRWHAGAPDDASYVRAYDELWNGICSDFTRLKIAEPQRVEALPEKKPSSALAVSKNTSEFVADSYGKALVELAKEKEDFVLLDADLSLDCRIREFEDTYPKRFIEMGIAEQDMVSMASGLALQGLLPICNSFANFLAARGNEQIYNALSENRKIIFACHFAGVIPAGPGKSHQSARDISLFGAFPNVTILQPSSGAEARLITRYMVLDAKESCMVRLNIGPSPRIIDLPKNYRLEVGRGFALSEGRENVLFAYGPVMLNEALTAAELLKAKGVTLKVVNLPWLNRFDKEWLRETLAHCENFFVLEDHSPFGGLGDHLFSFMNREGLIGKLTFTKFGVEGFPVCGTPWEALRAHRLDGETLSIRVLEKVNGKEG